MKKYWVVLLVLFSTVGNSQYSLTGEIIDDETNEPLAFVNIILNTGKVTSTNINGMFEVFSSEQITSLECKYVGYKTKVVAISSSKIIIKLKAKEIKLKEFVVLPGENPAHRIIKNATKNRKLNNPYNLSSFHYHSYNKTTLRMDSVHNINDTVIIDSGAKERIPSFLIESVSKKTYLAPDIEEEIVVANRVSGFANPSFSSVVTQLQPFSFYKNTITIIDKHYLNPISKGSTKKYFFLIEDTLFTGKDTTYIISYRPRKGKNFDGLQGLLYINTHRFAIQNVIAEPYEKGFISMKIQQKYSCIDSQYWFPKELNYQLIIRNYPAEGFGTKTSGEAFIDSVVINPPLRRKDLSSVSFRLEKGANDKDLTYWEKQRKTPLTDDEIYSFHVIDSLGKEFGFDNKLRFVEKLVSGKIPVKFLDIDLSKSLVSNNYEGFRLGLGASTNEKISKWFSVGGFFGYGLKDKEWKYGGDLTLFLRQKNELELNVAHFNTLFETAESGINKFRISTFQANTFIGFQKDRVIGNSAELSFRAFRYAKVNFSFASSKLSPRYEYAYKGENLSNTFFHTSEAGVFVKYSFKERLAENFNQRLSLGTTYPVLSVSYSRGIEGLLGGDFEYNKIEARIEASHFFKGLGRTSIRIQGGYIDNPLPYNLQFSGFGIRTGDFSVFIPYSFQTVTPYEFVMDKYAVTHFSHSFGSLLFKSESFKPMFTIHQQAGFGTLSNIQDHGLVEIKTMEKGFFESGLQIDNLLRMNYFNIAYLGLGVGINYRYGYYQLPELKDNFAFNVSFVFTTN